MSHPMIPVGVKFPPPMLDFLRTQAKIESMSLGAYVRRAVSYWLAHSGATRQALKGKLDAKGDR